MQGWIKLHRKLMDKAIWLESTPEQKSILITLLMMANHKENEWEWQGGRFKAEPGQFITSLEGIASKCGKGISIQNVRTALKRFEKYGFLTNQSTNRNRLITIINWNNYQGSDKEVEIISSNYGLDKSKKATSELTGNNDPSNTTIPSDRTVNGSSPNKQTNSQLTGNQQAVNKQLTTNKNDKNDKEVVVGENSFAFYQNNFGLLTPFISENIGYWIDDLSEELVIESMKIALKAGKGFDYAEGVLKKWKSRGIISLDDVKAEQRLFKRNREKRNIKDVDWEGLDTSE